jgi:hypothetical protein
MLYNRKVDRFLIMVVPVALFLYASTRPIVRLRTEMPLSFVDTAASATAKQRAAEERLARKYWSVAISVIQWRYTYGSPLPDTPPQEFRVYGESPSVSAPLSDSRLRYWHRLQQAWPSPEVWQKSREWSTQWLTDPVVRAGEWLDRTVKDAVGNP